MSFSLPSEINGVLRLFQIQYQLADMVSEVETLNVTVDVGNAFYRVLVSDLRAFTMYSVRVRAATGAAFGPFTPAINITTLEAGERVCVRDTSSGCNDHVVYTTTLLQFLQVHLRMYLQKYSTLQVLSCHGNHPPQKTKMA